MNLRQEFEGLDLVPWVRYDGESIPAALRALASEDAERADEAFEELGGQLLDQEDGHPATVHAIPFMARLAAAGVRTSALLDLLGLIAETGNEADTPSRHTRDAVSAQLPLLLPLLGHKDPEVRRLAIWAIAHCRKPEESWREISARWGVESEPAVRADLLFGSVLIDPLAARVIVLDALSTDQPDQVRIAALVASLDAGLAWTSQASDTTVSLLPASKRIGQTPWLYDPFPEIVERLLTQAETNMAIELVEAALRSGNNAEARNEGLWGAKTVGDRHPELRIRLLPAMLPLLDDTDNNVVPLASRWGKSDSTVRKALLDLASQEDAAVADRALAVLISMDAPEAPALLAQGLPRRPRALAATAMSEAGGRIRYVRPIACQEALLDAIRTRLVAVDANEEASHLLGLLEHWGTAARSAIPELLAVLPRYPVQVPGVLARVALEPGADRDAAVRALRAATHHAEGGRAAAEALRTLNEAS